VSLWVVDDPFPHQKDVAIKKKQQQHQQQLIIIL